MAAHDGELEIPRSYVRWTVDTRNVDFDDTLYSSKFGFESSQWQLSYNCDEDGHHKLYLEKDSWGSHAPLDVTVQLEDVGTERIMKEDLSDGDYLDENRNYKLIWCKAELDIVRSDPEFGRKNYELRFLVELKKKHFLAGEECTCATCQFIAADGNVTSLESFSKDLGDLLDQDASADVEFRCVDADGNILTTVKAHKLLVCARSPVLASMLHIDMVEGRTGVATIRDIDAGVFKQFLKYLYSGKLNEITVDAATSLYEAGDRFQVKSLTKHCAKWMVRNLTIENSCDVLALADAHCDEELAEATLAFMANREVPHSFDGWDDFCSKHPSLSIRVFKRFCKLLKGMSPEGEYSCSKRRRIV